tara:strand:+ start:135 stop:509 length:375 start_codon:yes stop_codon:yes gene_type:complete
MVRRKVTSKPKQSLEIKKTAVRAKPRSVPRTQIKSLELPKNVVKAPPKPKPKPKLPKTSIVKKDATGKRDFSSLDAYTKKVYTGSLGGKAKPKPASTTTKRKPRRRKTPTRSGIFSSLFGKRRR